MPLPSVQHIRDISFQDHFLSAQAFAQRLADRLDEERRSPPAAADGAGPAPAPHDTGYLTV